MLEKSIFRIKVRFYKFRSKLYRLWIKFRMKSSGRRNRLAKGLVNNCTSCGPLTEDQKRANRLSLLLRDTLDPEETMKHFELLNKESDPLKDIKEIPDNSVKVVHSGDSVSTNNETNK